MSRSARSTLAQETVAISERGEYRLADGRTVSIRDPLSSCLEGTLIVRSEELDALRREILASEPLDSGAAIEVRNETTLAGARRLWAESHDPIAVLNFASARNPGGGFLNGSEAQEESLARSSALYASQQKVFSFYEAHRAQKSCLYSDAMILSPDCPVFRDDAGRLLDEPYTVTFLTSPAPNAGAIASNAPEELPLVPETLKNRAELVLTLAVHAGCERIILGAWGCGVFRNDPRMVASTFAELLFDRGWSRRFRTVLFSVFDRGEPARTFRAFEEALSPR